MVRTTFKPTRERKQRRKAQSQQQPESEQQRSVADLASHSHDPNAEIIIPSTDAKAQRRAELLSSMARPKMSSKKAKRLNKYIENKLRKEETNALLAKLAETKVDTSLFVSAKDIGKAKETKKEKVRRALAELDKGLRGTNADEILFVEREVRGIEEWEEVVGRREENEDEVVSDIMPSADMEVKATSVENANTQSTEEQQEQRIQDSAALERALLEKSLVVSTAGGGLKRPLELDESGKPILKKIKRTKAPHELVRATPAPVKFDYDKQDEEMRDGDSEEEDEDEEDEFSMDEDEKEHGKEANYVDEDDEEAEEWYGFSDSVNGENGVEVESPAEEILNSDSTDRSDDESEEGAEGEEGGDEDEDDEDEDDEDEDDEDEDDEDDEESDEGPIPLLKKGTSAAASAFKAWAESARLKALGVDEPKSENNIPTFPKLPAGVTLPRRASSSSPPPQPLPPSSTTLKPASYVTVNRPENIQLSRLALPIVALEQPIMETISTNSTVVICGATGSGKTTQVPQFLFEAGYGNPKSEDTPGLIGITQPRRVAAVSMAKRVQEELGEEHAVKVGYQIRFEGTVGSETAIKFMTDGVLLRELAKDFLLSKYSAIVIDEAHERGVNTDILIGVMSRVVKLREEMHKEGPTKTKLLKLIIMSATLRVSDFTENKSLFSTPPPVINAEARQFPVSVHFSRRTSRDYVDEAYRKICKMHRRLPPGGILVFLTGQNEIQYLMKKLRKAFPLPKAEKEEEEKNEKEPKVKIVASEAVMETEDIEFKSTTDSNIHKILTEEGEDERLGEEEIDFVSDPDNESDLGDAEQEGRENATGGSLGEEAIAPLHILPLYSLLPTAQQLRIFSPPPPGHRLCVLATNIAETSLTIPNISYVVDTGRVKSRTYNKSTGVTSYDITWVSKASASQRAGRAGRTGPGHCYRLYSSAVYERDFDQFAVPEIMQMPIEGVVLQMKGMNIEKIVNFPFPTPPEKEELRRAERVLGYLGALRPPTNNTADVGIGMLTDMGRTMTMFPLPPRFAKILIIGQQHGCLPYVIAIVSALSIGELFIPEHQLNLPAVADDEDEEENQDTNKPAPSVAENLATSRAQAQRKAYYAAQRTFSQLDPTCDVLRLLAVVCAFEYEYSVSGSSSAETWCGKHYLRYKGMLETRRLRKQLTDIVKSNCPGAAAALVPPKSKNGTKKQLQKPLDSLLLDPPSQIQTKALKQIIAAGFIDQIAIRADLLPPGSCGTADPLPPLKKYNRMTTVPFVPLNPPSENTPFAFIHPSSPLAQVHPTTAPQFIIYSALTVAGNASVTSTPGRVRMLPLTPLASGKIVATLAKGTRLLSYSKPLGGKVDIVATEGGGQRKEVWVKQLLRREGGAGGVGWELGVEKVGMTKKGGGWVVEEK